MPFIYKSSFDKANRSSHTSYRGPGIEAGLRILERVRDEVGVPVLTDVHEDTPLDEVADVVAVLQTPAFLCRQTNFITNVCAQNKPVNIKKGQFLAPGDMRHVVNKAPRHRQRRRSWSANGARASATTTWVSDMRSLAIMRETGCPVVYDATHSVQMPGGRGETSGRAARDGAGTGARGGRRRRGGPVHGDAPRVRREALSDGPNSWPLDRMAELLEGLVAIDGVVKARAYLEDGPRAAGDDGRP